MTVCVLLGERANRVLSHTKKFDWICRAKEPFTLDRDGKSVFQQHSVMQWHMSSYGLESCGQEENIMTKIKSLKNRDQKRQFIGVKISLENTSQ